MLEYNNVPKHLKNIFSDIVKVNSKIGNYYIYEVGEQPTLIELPYDQDEEELEEENMEDENHSYKYSKLINPIDVWLRSQGILTGEKVIFVMTW